MAAPETVVASCPAEEVDPFPKAAAAVAGRVPQTEVAGRLVVSPAAVAAAEIAGAAAVTAVGKLVVLVETWVGSC